MNSFVMNWLSPAYVRSCAVTTEECTKKGVFLPRRYFTIFVHRDILNSPIFNLSPIAGIQTSLAHPRIFGEKYAPSTERPSSEEVFPGGLRQPFTEAVICPYSGCPFSTDDGEAMKRHQQETRHPGWGRCEEKPVDKKWICPKEVCGASFLAWDHLYRHMMVHSRPLGCTVCPFGAAKSTRLKRHMKESGHDSATKADESHVHWKRKRGSSVLREQ